jgi:transcription elongation factor Elf1
LSHQDENFHNNEVYRVAYKPLRNPAYTQVFDVELVCPSCGCNRWIYQNRTGVGKLSRDQMKLKCEECGQYFICNKEEITKIMGL